MTETEIIEKLKFFKENLLRFKTERNEAREERVNLQLQLNELNETISTLNEKASLGETLKAELDEKTIELENIRKEFEEAKVSAEDKYNDLKTKTYHSIKHLVEDVIEKYEVEVAELTKELSESNESFNKAISDNEVLLNKIDTLESEVNNINRKYESYVSPEDYQKAVDEMAKKTSEADSKTQTVLENTWKEQKRLEEELREKANESKSYNEEMATLRSQIQQWELFKVQTEQEMENLRTEVNTKDNLVNEYKTAMQNINIENTQKIHTLNNQIKTLESDNKDLLEKVSILEEQLRIFKEPRKEASARVIKKENTPSSLIGETVPFKFGRTSNTIMDKVKQFIAYLYLSAKYDSADNTTIILGDPVSAKDTLSLTDKEYEVFMDRLQRLESDGMPLVYNDNGVLKTKFEKNWMIDFISSVVK